MFIVTGLLNLLFTYFFSYYIIMETATLVAISISGLLVSFTGYALYTAFGQPSQQLRDPFEEHGD